MYLVIKLKKIVNSILGRKSKASELKYNIGNKKYHNSMIDGLVPGLVTIGDNFISAPGSTILAHDASTYVHTGKYRVEKTTLGDNVFLGANSIVMPGVSIGDNVIVGAGSVVTKDLESNSVYAGNPAKYICSLDSYIDKCQGRGVLLSPPEGFSKQFENKRIALSDINAFNDNCLSCIRDKE